MSGSTRSTTLLGRPLSSPEAQSLEATTLPNKHSVEPALPADSTASSSNVEEVQKDGLDEGDSLWEKYNSEARGYDEELVGRSVKNLDALLVFSGLFSAILTAFIIESYQWLEPDPAEQTVDLLRSLYAVQTGTERVEETPFEAPVSLVWVNAMWFASLAFTLSASLVILLLKQVMDEFSLRKANGTAKEQALLRQHRFDGIVRWRIIAVIEFLPTLFHTALGLFFVGLILLLETLHRKICIMMGVIGGFLTLLYLIVTMSPLFGSSPFRSPLLAQLRLRVHPFIHAYSDGTFTRAPGVGREDIIVKPNPIHTVADFEKVSIKQRTLDLTGSCIEWLATTSTNRDTVSASLRSISSIPFYMDEGYSKLISRPLLLELTRHVVDAAKASSGDINTQPYGMIMATLLRQALDGRLPSRSVDAVRQTCLSFLGDWEYLNLVRHSPDHTVMMDLQTRTMVLYSMRPSARTFSMHNLVAALLPTLHLDEGRAIISNEAMRRSQHRSPEETLDLAHFFEAFTLCLFGDHQWPWYNLAGVKYLEEWETRGEENWQQGYWHCGKCHFVGDLLSFVNFPGESHDRVLYGSIILSLGLLQCKTRVERKAYTSNYRGVRNTSGSIFINPRLGMMAAMRTLIDFCLEHEHEHGAESLRSALKVLPLVLTVEGWKRMLFTGQKIRSAEMPSTNDLIRLIEITRMAPDSPLFAHQLLETVCIHFTCWPDQWPSKEPIISWVLELYRLAPLEDSCKSTTRQIILQSGIPWAQLNPVITQTAMDLVVEWLRDTDLQFADDTAKKILETDNTPMSFHTNVFEGMVVTGKFVDGSLNGDVLNAVADLYAARIATWKMTDRNNPYIHVPDFTWPLWGRSLHGWGRMGVSWNPTNLPRFSTADAAARQRLIEVLIVGYDLVDDVNVGNCKFSRPYVDWLDPGEVKQQLVPANWEERYTMGGCRYFRERDLGVDSMKDPRAYNFRESFWSAWPSGWRRLPKGIESGAPAFSV